MKNIKIKINKIVNCIIAVIFITSISCKSNKTKDEPIDEVKHTIMVFSAASLTDVLSEIIDSFETKYPVEVKTNLASSGTLARQIEQGGTPDVYISASKKWANYVDSLEFLLKGYKQEIAKNELVLIAPADGKLALQDIDSTTDLVSLLNTGKLSMGDPAHVPAGKYAKQSLEYYGWFDEISPKILPAKDVRSALMVVEMGEAPLGIVYVTDAKKSRKVKIFGTFPEASHKPIVYVAGVCKEGNDAKEFFNFLNSAETIPIWTKYGFKK